MIQIDADALIEFIKDGHWHNDENVCAEIIEEIEKLAIEGKNRELDRLRKELEFAQHEAITSYILSSFPKQ